MKRYDKDIDKIFNPYSITPMENLVVRNDKNRRGYRTKTIKSGTRMKECISYPIPKRGDGKKIEKIIREYSPEKRKIYHQQEIEKNAVRLIVENFDTKDCWLTVTYRDGIEPQSDAEAEKDLDNYIRRLQYHSTKNGWGKMKYFGSTEGGEGTRYHHHLVCSFKDMQLAEDLWKLGTYPKSERCRIYAKKGLEGMAAYIAGHDKEDKPSKRHKHRKAYKASQGLRKPWKHRTEGGRMTFSDSKIKKSIAEKLGTGRLSIKEYYEKQHKGYEVVECSARRSDYMDGWYIYVQMIKRE